MVTSRVLASSTSYYSEVEIAWKPSANDSRVDIYHYQVINGMNASVILESETTNTNVTVVIDTDGVNISFVLSACNCKGRSAQVTLGLAGDFRI